MPSAYLLLFVANVVFATSYGVTRVVLDDVPAALDAMRRREGGRRVVLFASA